MKKSTALAVILPLCAALLALGAYAASVVPEGQRARQVERLNGEAALAELARSLGDMAEDMEEAGYVEPGPLRTRLCAKASANAASALTAFSGLPYATHELERTAEYINAAGDYLLYLSASEEGGGASLRELTETVSELAEETALLTARLSDGAVEMDEYGDGADEGRTDTVGYELRRMEENLPELPELRYDGEYSASALEEREPALLSGEQEKTELQARKVAAELLGVGEEELESGGRSEGSPAVYGFTHRLDDRIRGVQVTVRGARVLSVTDSREVSEGGLTAEQAAASALEYADKLGYGDMEARSVGRDGAVFAVTLVYASEGVAWLPDTILAAVASDTGEVCGFDAAEYVMNHSWRATPSPELDAAAAAAALPSGGADAEEARLCVWLSEGGEERLCWELPCGGEALCYVNALTGKTEEVALIP